LKIVVKIGGSLMKEGIPAGLLRDVAALSRRDRLVIVHGGGEVVTEYAGRLGKEQRFVVSPEGIRSRYTDSETAEIYQMVMSGLLAKRLVLALGREGVKAVSVAGADGSLLQGKRKTRLVIVDGRGRRVAVEGGFTGRVESVNSSLLSLLQSDGYVPVISPVAASEKGEPLNIDGDRAASAVALATGAEAVIFATNVEGVLLDGGLVRHLSPREARSKAAGVGFGMQKKVIAAVEAVEGGVREGIICSGSKSEPLAKAMAHDSCTVVSQG
jgi:[amino group carrier protein]-L-2-aminoadipate/L-glutamate 6-kinase